MGRIYIFQMPHCCWFLILIAQMSFHVGHTFFYIDTETLYTITIQQIANQYGGKVFTWEMKSRLMGMMGREAAVAIIETLDLHIKPEEYMNSSQQIMARMFPSCQFLPGQPRKKACVFRPYKFFVVGRRAWNITLDSIRGRMTAIQGPSAPIKFYYELFFIFYPPTPSHESGGVTV